MNLRNRKVKKTESKKAKKKETMSKKRKTESKKAKKEETMPKKRKTGAKKEEMVPKKRKVSSKKEEVEIEIDHIIDLAWAFRHHNYSTFRENIIKHFMQ